MAIVPPQKNFYLSWEKFRSWSVCDRPHHCALPRWLCASAGRRLSGIRREFEARCRSILRKKPERQARKLRVTSIGGPLSPSTFVLLKGSPPRRPYSDKLQITRRKYGR